MSYIRFMHASISTTIIRFFFLSALVSCRESFQVPDLEGSLVGYVITHDEFANPLDDHGDVEVTIVGERHIAQTHTDADGRFEFHRLPAGTYELYLKKWGYGTFIQPGIQHLGGEPTILGLTFTGSPSDAFLMFPVPTTEIDLLSVSNDTITGNFTFAGEQPYSLLVMIYLSDETGFKQTKAKRVVSRYLLWDKDKFKGFMQTAVLPFLPGTTVYYRGAVVVGKDLYYSSNHIGIIDSLTYVDYYFGRILHPNLGHVSEEYSFVMPE